MQAKQSRRLGETRSGVRERDVKHRGVAETAGHLVLLLLSASVRKMSNLRQTAHAQQLGCRQESVSADAGVLVNLLAHRWVINNAGKGRASMPVDFIFPPPLSYGIYR